MNEDIHDIAESGSIEDMQILLKKGININTLDEDDNTPLHFSIDRKEPEMTLFLLENGADPTIQNDEGYTALHLSVLYQNIEIAEAILKRFPQVVNIESEEWGSPLLQALQNIEMVKLLIAYGANKQADNILPHVKAYDIDELSEIFSEELKGFKEL
ncbi:MAG: hypothetical protein CSB47_09980 [Proteobacteria bacterium]|nr:MAG: hypothetical protein CSB47_09980 [Pseudomonadota bacterium]